MKLQHSCVYIHSLHMYACGASAPLSQAPPLNDLPAANARHPSLVATQDLEKVARSDILRAPGGVQGAHAHSNDHQHFATHTHYCTLPEAAYILGVVLWYSSIHIGAIGLQ